MSRACQLMSVSWETYFRYKTSKDQGDIEVLLDKPRPKPNMKHRVELQIEKAVLNIAFECPTHGHIRVSNKLR